MVPRRGGFHKTVAIVERVFRRQRYTIVLAAIHRRRRSCAPPHRDGTSSDGRRLHFGQRRAAVAIRFNGKHCYSATNDPSSSRVATTLTHTFCFFYPPPYSKSAATATDGQHCGFPSPSGPSWMAKNSLLLVSLFERAIVCYQRTKIGRARED